MSETRFTPGPWRAQLDEKSVDAGGRLLADVYDLGKPPSKNRQQANIHLIAAAPDLYSALEGARECLAEILEDTTDDAGNWVRNPLLVEIEAALAKARGEAPNV